MRSYAVATMKLADSNYPLLISHSHEDENTDLMLSSVFVLNPFLGDITRFFESGRRFYNQTATRGRSFCGISNRVLGSMLVMIRRDRHWLVLFIFNRKNELFRISTKLAFLPTFSLPVGHTKNCAQLHTIVFPMRGRMFWLALLQSSAWTSPLFLTGVPSVTPSVIMLVNK